MSQCTVTVLMSTYNGACYLQEQLSSIYEQTGVDCSVLVRDDGSTDVTLSILEAEQALGRLTWYSGSNVGPAFSFWDLLRTASGSEYYAFSDQDDVWHKDKLAVAVEALKACGDRPALYFCQTQLADEHLNPLENVSIHPLLTLGEALVYQFVGGSTMVFNEALRRKLIQYTPRYMRMHDIWVYDVALAVDGFVYFDPTPHVLYRQHGGNAVGQLNSTRFRWKNRWNRICRNEHIRLRTAEELLRGYASEMRPENRELVTKVVEYRKSCGVKWSLLSDKRLRCSDRSIERTGKLSILLNIF
ncbi:MAG: glycosyltransferase family 2 protein [Clostridium sp.]|nr:glycosyltransferase family 2 protein [Clostridium sp.]